MVFKCQLLSIRDADYYQFEMLITLRSYKGEFKVRDECSKYWFQNGFRV